jgi:two-component system, LytTR family, response regulator
MISFLPNSLSESSELSGTLDSSVRVLVAEPDTVSRRVICSVLENEADVSFQCVEHSDVVTAIQESAPDLVIVDAQASALRRAANWEALGVKSPPATILTSYDRTSLMPFASSSADLLLKPLNVEQFENAIDTARSKIAGLRAKLNDSQENKRRADGAAGKPALLQRFVAESEGRIVLIKIPDVLWLQSVGNYLRVHTASAAHMVRNTMRKVHPHLDPCLFIRIHRNAIVNLDHVVEFFLPATGNMFVRLDNGASLPLRRSSRASLRKFLKQSPLV